MNSFPSHTGSAPYGYNDNSSSVFNRFIPSNNPVQSVNSVNNYTNYTKPNPNTLYNYNKSFQLNNQLIEPIDYSNQNSTLHNNIGPTVLDEFIEEYRINIDSGSIFMEL